jgi:rhodanese-related sulfurtransferase
MGPREASPKLDDFCVVDVRSEGEFRGPLGHIHDSVLIPLPDLDSRAKELPRGRALLLVCRSGKRSRVACEKLIELDVGPVVNLEGGMIAWNLAQLPVERPTPESLASNAPTDPDRSSDSFRRRLLAL